MAKMKYGIDLGTTNSAICKMEHGEPKIIKTTTQKDILPSCVACTSNGRIIVGDRAVAQLNNDRQRAAKSDGEVKQNVFIEFKRTMGLDTNYHSSNMELKKEKADFNSEELSAEILKELKAIASNASDNERINSIVVTIPARFSAQQSEATQRATKLAGFENCFLLQEPVAAATAYAYATTCKNGYWLVFDFGGGTFDAALLDVRDGVMTVVDTGGNAFLGGKNLDYAIVDELFLPRLRSQYAIENLLSNNSKKQKLREVLKPVAEEFKNELSTQETWEFVDDFFTFGEDDNGNETGLNLSISQDDLKPVFTPWFQNAIDMCKDLLSRNNLNGNQLDKLILVGGPTHSPILRQMLKEQITNNIDTSIDPMTAVAKGAAIYAATIEEPITPNNKTDEQNRTSILLDVKYNPGAVREKAPVSVVMPNQDDTKVFYVQLCRPDGTWSSDKMKIGKGAVIQCLLDMSKKSNTFSIKLTDDMGNTYSCEPNEIVFMSVKPPTQTLAYNIGIEIIDLERDRAIFMPIKGLEKNQPTRAEGEKKGLFTMSDLVPGDENSKVTIPIYEGDNNTEGTSTIYNKHVFDVVLTGDDVPELIPKNSEISIKIVVEKDMTKHLSATFPKYDFTIEKRIEIGTSSSVSVSELKRNFDEAKFRLHSFESSGVIPAEEIRDAKSKLDDISSRFESEIQQDDGKEHLLDSLREVFRQLEEVEKNHEWDTIEAKLRHEFDRLERANNDLGNKYDQEVSELHRQTDAVIRSHDIKTGRKVLKAIGQLFFEVTRVYQLIAFIKHYDNNFSVYTWQDHNQARQLLNQGNNMIASGDIDEDQLLGICQELISLLPEYERNDGPGVGI